MRVVLAKIDIANHVEVVVVDVEDFDGILIHQGVWERPAHDFSLCVVDSTLVVSVVKLSRTDQRNHARRINVVSDLLFNDRDVVSLSLVQERNAALYSVGSLHSPPDFVIAWRIQSFDGSAGCEWPHDGHSCVALVNVELVLVHFLLVWGYWDGNTKDSKSRACPWKTSNA